MPFANFTEYINAQNTKKILLVEITKTGIGGAGVGAIFLSTSPYATESTDTTEIVQNKRPNKIKNSTFNSNTDGWWKNSPIGVRPDWVTGELKLYSSTGDMYAYTMVYGLIVGKAYLVRATGRVSVNTGGWGCRVVDVTGVTIFGQRSITDQASQTSSVTLSFKFIATTTAARVDLMYVRSVADPSVYIDNVELYEHDESTNIVTNGEFTTNATGWSAGSGSPTFGVTASRLYITTSASVADVAQTIPTTPGQRYRFRCRASLASSSANVSATITTTPAPDIAATTTTVTLPLVEISGEFTATSTTSTIHLVVNNPSLVVSVTCYFDDVFIDEINTVANRIYAPLIAPNGLPRIKHQLQEPLKLNGNTQYGDIVVSRSLVPVLNRATISNYNLFNGKLRGADIRVRLAAPRELYPYSDSIILMSGVLDVVSGNLNGEIRITTKSRQALLDSVSIPNQTFATGENAGRVKPVGFGNVKYAAPVLVDSAAFKYLVHDGPIGFVNTVYDNGAAVELTFSATVTAGTNALQLPLGSSVSSTNGYYVNVHARSVSNSWRIVTAYDGATHIATVATNWTTTETVTVRVQLFTQNLGSGEFTLLNKPLGDVSADYDTVLANQGSKTFRDLLTEVIDQYTEVSYSDRDLTYINNHSSAAASWYIDEPTNTWQLLQQLAHGSGNYVVIRRDGTFRAESNHTIVNYPAITFAANELIGEIEIRQQTETYHALFIGYDVNYRPLSNPSSVLTEAVRNNLRRRFKEYRYDQTQDNFTKEISTVVVSPFETALTAALNPSVTFNAIRPSVNDESMIFTVVVPMRSPLVCAGDWVQITGIGYDSAYLRCFSTEDYLQNNIPVQKLELWKVL